MILILRYQPKKKEDSKLDNHFGIFRDQRSTEAITGYVMMCMVIWELCLSGSLVGNIYTGDLTALIALSFSQYSTNGVEIKLMQLLVFIN
jgi:hypothetical protein